MTIIGASVSATRIFVMAEQWPGPSAPAGRRIAGADVLPYGFTSLADTVHQYAAELQKPLSGKSGASPRVQPAT
jgi:hypothetical protein